MKIALNKTESIEMLDAHRGRLNTVQYNRIEWVIGQQAIENIFPSQESIDRMVRVEIGEITINEGFEEILSAR